MHLRSRASLRSLFIRVAAALPQQQRRTLAGDGSRRTKGPRNTKGFDYLLGSGRDVAGSATKTVAALESLVPPAIGPRRQVRLEISSGGAPAADVVIALLDDYVPLSSGRFATLCERGYAATTFHRLIRGVSLIGGELRPEIAANLPPIPDEAFVMSHGAPGVVSLLTAGRDTSRSQFLVTLSSQTQIDGRCVPVGYVVRGMDTLAKIAASTFCFMQKPVTPIVIERCGLVPRNDPRVVTSKASTSR